MRVGVLGPVEVIADDGTTVALGPRKQRVLLAALALRANRVVPSAVLIDGVWGDSPPPSSANLVQGYVSKLKRLLSESRVVYRDGGYVLRAEPEELDVDCFDRLARTGRMLLANDPEGASEAFARALALWRGSPFSELPDLDEARAESARLDELHVEVIEGSLEAELLAGRHREAVSALEAATRLYPLRERLRELHMIALYRSGRQADALAVFQDARRTLVEELGIEPGPGLRTVEDAVLRQEPWLMPHGAPTELAEVPNNPAPLGMPGDLAVTGSSVFFGRERHLTDALDVVLGTERAEGIWVLGEPGVGKSRLAAEIARLSAERGATVLFGRCDELVNDSFQPVIQALRWFASRIEDQALAGALGADPTALARLVPEIRTRVAGIVGDAERVTELEQYRLFEAVRSWLSSVGTETPVLLVVDDAHWADRATLAMLAHVLRSTDRARLTVLLTARDTAPDVNPALAEIADRLQQDRCSRTFRLEGLGAGEAGQLLRELTPGIDVSGAVSRRVAEDTAGNPLFVAAVAAGLRSGDDAVPADVRTAVRLRVRRLGEPSRDVLGVAALIGLEFPLQVLARAAGHDEASCLALVEHAVEAGLVEELGFDRFRFSHALVREAMAAEPLQSKRARLHRAIAEAIEASFAADLSDHLRALAYHCSRAESPELLRRAFDYALRSARRATAQLAFAASVEDFSLALEIAERLGFSQRRTELLLNMGEAQLLAGQHDVALDTLEAAASSARDDGAWDTLARAAMAYGEASWRGGLFSVRSAILLGEAARHRLSGNLNVAVKSALGRALYFCGQVERAETLAKEAVDEARASGDPGTLRDTLQNYWKTLQHRPTTPLQLELAREVDDLTEWIADRITPGLLGFLGPAVASSIALGDGAGARRLLVRLDEAANKTGMRFDRYAAMGFNQVVTFLDGDLEGAEARADALLEHGREMGWDLSGSHGVQYFLIRREQDRLAELAPAVRLVVRANDAEAMWRPGLIALLAEIGLDDDVSAHLERYAEGGFAELPRDEMFAGSLCLFAEAAARLGGRATRSEVELLLEPWSSQAVWIGYTVGNLGSAARYMGLLAAADGRIDEAEARFTEALSFNRRLGSPVWTAHVLADWAGLAFRVGNLRRATAMSSEARRLAERHGLAAVLRQLDSVGNG